MNFLLCSSDTSRRKNSNIPSHCSKPYWLGISLNRKPRFFANRLSWFCVKASSIFYLNLLPPPKPCLINSSYNLQFRGSINDFFLKSQQCLPTTEKVVGSSPVSPANSLSIFLILKMYYNVCNYGKRRRIGI